MPTPSMMITQGVRVKRREGIHLRGRIYWITYMLHGKQCFESSRSPDLRTAKSLLEDRKAQIKQGRLTINPSTAPLFSELLKTYISQVENQHTQKRYRLAAAVLMKHIADICINFLRAQDFDDFKTARLRQEVTPAGINRELALARAALNLAVERREIPFSPFSGVRLFDESFRPTPRSLTFTTERQILDQCDPRLKTLVSVLVETGLRVGIEALPMKWADVDFTENTITVVQSKTSSGLRVIPMTKLCRMVLSKWREINAGASKYVFFNPLKPDRHIQSVKTAWRNTLRKSCVEHLPIYNCRHTFGTRLAGSGVSDTIIDQLMGHSRRDVLRFYTARNLDHHRDAIARLDELRRVKTEQSLKIVAPVTQFPIAKGSLLIQ